jgi:hypothetical protein
MKENGKTTKCMELAYLDGPTEESTKEHTSKTRNKDAASSHGLMDESTLASGWKASNMGKECMLRQAASNAKENGQMANDLSGSSDPLINSLIICLKII